MKKLLLGTLLALAAGCASVEVSTTGLNAIYVQNSCTYLFYCLPLFSGDPDYPNQQVCNWFEDTCKLETNIRLLEEEAQNQHAVRIRNAATHSTRDTLFFPFLNRQVLHTSAEFDK